MTKTLIKVRKKAGNPIREKTATLLLWDSIILVLGPQKDNKISKTDQSS